MTALSHISIRATGDLIHSSMPKDHQGHTYFLGLKIGEIANRILIVDSTATAQRVRKVLDLGRSSFESTSTMGITTITGKKYGIPVTILAIGPGVANMDAAIREIHSITEGPLTLMHLGFSTAVLSDASLVRVVVTNKSIALQTNYKASHCNPLEKRFLCSTPLRPDNELRRVLNNHIDAYVKPAFAVREATSVTFDTVEARQNVQQLQPDATSVDMKTHYLYDLANKLSFRAIACSIIDKNIHGKSCLGTDEKIRLEELMAKSCIQTLVKLP